MGSELEVEQGAAKQRGLISRDAARAAGMSTSAIFRRLRSGRWLTVHPGVYRVAGVPESWEQTVLAMCLWTGGVASHETAAALWSLGKPPPKIDVLVDRGTFVAHERLRLHRSVALSAADRGLRDGIPVTNLPRTLIDLASVLEDEPLEVALHEAMRVHRLEAGWLRRRLEALQPGRAGTERLSSMLRARDPRSRSEEQSWLESRLKVFLRRRGFPPPFLQHPVGEGNRHFGFFDFAYPDQKLVLEVDGYRYHSDRFAWSRDRRRMADLASIGWRVLPVTAADFDQPARLEGRLRDALALPRRKRGRPRGEAALLGG